MTEPTTNVVQFPSSVSRHAHARKPRRSKNSTPEESRQLLSSFERGELVKAGIARARENGVRIGRPPHLVTDHVPALTGERWDKMIVCFTREQQQALMVDVWKVINRHFRKL
jgi:hypothetical protein